MGPFSTARSDDCAPVIPGKTVTCSKNNAGHHAALCYCKGSAGASASAPAPAPAPGGGEWVKGANGKTCDATCAAKGKTCDVSELNKLTSNAKVGAAFKQAGYTCKGYHAPRDYAGTPFSTARSDDCAPVIPGKTVTC